MSDNQLETSSEKMTVGQEVRLSVIHNLLHTGCSHHEVLEMADPIAGWILSGLRLVAEAKDQQLNRFGFSTERSELNLKQLEIDKQKALLEIAEKNLSLANIELFRQELQTQSTRIA